MSPATGIGNVYETLNPTIAQSLIDPTAVVKPVSETSHPGLASDTTIAAIPSAEAPPSSVATRFRTPQELFRWAPARFLAILALCLSVSLLITGPSRSGWLDFYTTVAWSSYVLGALWGLRGASYLRKLPEVAFADHTSIPLDIIVPTVLRMNVLPALVRVVDQTLHYAPAHFEHFRIEVVTEEGAEGIASFLARYGRNPRVSLLVVPAEYATPHGARYKARANHYALAMARMEGRVGADRWRYHLDDDTAPGPGTFAAIAEFVEMNREGPDVKHLAQGVLTFPHELAPKLVPRLLDAMRPGDDKTRFAYFTGAKGTPLIGLHGEHMLARASVVEEIGWDFGPVRAEDAYFGLHFSRKYPGQAGFLPAYCYGASPGSVADLVRQRRRWAAGLLELVADRRIRLRDKAHLSFFVALWSLGVFQYVGFVLGLAWLTGQTTAPVFHVVLALWSFNVAYQLWVYWEGMRTNLAVSGSCGRWHALGHTVLLIPALFTLTVVESWASVLGIYQFLSRSVGFEVINKQC